MMRLFGYHRSSATYRVRIALHHKRIPFETVPVAIRAGEQRSPSHLARNPLGQVPVLEIDQGGRPVYLAQSLAIIEYLEELSSGYPLLPTEPVARARARELAEIVNAGTQPLQNSPVLEHLENDLHVDAKAWARRYIRRGLEALEARARLTAGAFLVGDAPSIADVCLVPQVFNARGLDVALDGLETLVRIERDCLALPGWDDAHPSRQPDAPVGL
jgi:maleylpyruvate isomerase